MVTSFKQSLTEECKTLCLGTIRATEHSYFYSTHSKRAWHNEKAWITVRMFCTGRCPGGSVRLARISQQVMSPTSRHLGALPGPMMVGGAEMLMLLYVVLLPHPQRILLLRGSATCPDSFQRVTPCSASELKPLESWESALRNSPGPLFCICFCTGLLPRVFSKAKPCCISGTMGGTDTIHSLDTEIHWSLGCWLLLF